MLIQRTHSVIINHYYSFGVKKWKWIWIPIHTFNRSFQLVWCLHQWNYYYYYFQHITKLQEVFEPNWIMDVHVRSHSRISPSLEIHNRYQSGDFLIWEIFSSQLRPEGMIWQIEGEIRNFTSQMFSAVEFNLGSLWSILNY